MDELAKLRWQCRRGTRELDLLLTNYLETSYINASPADQRRFLDILDLEDSVLMARYDQLANLLNTVKQS